MSVQSNINSYYEELVSSIAEYAFEDLHDEGYKDCERSDIIWQSIDQRLIYYTDQAYVLARAMQNGFISWNDHREIWDNVWEMLYEDVEAEVAELEKNETEDDEQ